MGTMKMGKEIKILVLIASVIITLGVSCDLFDWLSGITETPPDTCPSWDTDCDNISNAVETNDANSYLGLRPDTADANPSIAHGSPCDGWIEKALNLVNSGTGYYHYLGNDIIDTDDWGVLHLINMIEGAGRDWYGSGYTPPRMGVGDLSWGDAQTQQFGGRFDPHECHQNGLEADFRYVRNDGQEISLNIAGPDSIYYDPGATAELMNSLIANGTITVIYIDTVHAYLVGDILEHRVGHSDHFHVRIEDPDGTGN